MDKYEYLFRYKGSYKPSQLLSLSSYNWHPIGKYLSLLLLLSLSSSLKPLLLFSPVLSFSLMFN